MNRRVVVTGLGVVTSLGCKVEELWRRLCNGESGIHPIERFDCSRFRSRFGGEIKNWSTEGWWNVAPDTCETLIAGALVSRFYYVYAVDYDRGGVWGGKAQMCTRDKMFTIHGIEDCVARGYEKTGFFEVDTGEQKSWTVQLTEPDQQGAGG